MKDVCVCVCVCACVRTRARARARASVCMCVILNRQYDKPSEPPLCVHLLFIPPLGLWCLFPSVPFNHRKASTKGSTTAPLWRQRSAVNSLCWSENYDFCQSRQQIVWCVMFLVLPTQRTVKACSFQTTDLGVFKLPLTLRAPLSGTSSKLCQI